MEKRRIFALLLIGLTVVVLLLTRGQTTVNLFGQAVEAGTAMMLLGFTALGVFIGLLLK